MVGLTPRSRSRSRIGTVTLPQQPSSCRDQRVCMSSVLNLAGSSRIRRVSVRQSPPSPSSARGPYPCRIPGREKVGTRPAGTATARSFASRRRRSRAMPPCSSPDPVGRNMFQDCIAAESPIPLMGRGIRVQLGSRMLLLSASGMIQVGMGSAPQPRRRSRNNRGSHPCMLSLLMNPDRFPKSIESGELSLLLRRSSRDLRGCMRSDRNPADSCPPHRGSLPRRRHRLRNFLD